MFIPDRTPVWWIRNVYPGSWIQLLSIPDPNCLHPGSSSKNLSILTPKKQKKWFLSSKKYVPGCSSRIPDPDADFLPSRIQGSKRHPIPDPNPQHWIQNTVFPGSGSGRGHAGGPTPGRHLRRPRLLCGQGRESPVFLSFQAFLFRTEII
jgi:hypothetical protein